MIIKNGLVYTEDFQFKTKDIQISGDTFSKIENSLSSEEQTIDATDCYVIPGLTDIHFHGCVGFDFCDGTKEAIQKMAAYQLKNGVTTICPATMTLAEETLTAICKCAADYRKEQQTTEDKKNMGSTLVGINMEGPFLSLAKKGAQNSTFLHKPDVEMFKRLQDNAEGLIKLVAIAPEEEGAMECIKELNQDVLFSVAHTTANYEIAKKAMDQGAKHVTHLYNAMPALSHRESGVIGAAFDTNDCDVELICDGVHISAPVVRATFKLFGDDRTILISDSMMATGMEDGKYALGGQPVLVKGNLATLEDGTIAGSATNLMDCLRVAVKSMDIPLESAVKAAAYNSARSIGIDKEYGSITAGKKANLVILDKELNIKQIVFEGQLI